MKDIILYIIFVIFLLAGYFGVEYYERKFHDDFTTYDEDYVKIK